MSVYKWGSIRSPLVLRRFGYEASQDVSRIVEAAVFADRVEDPQAEPSVSYPHAWWDQDVMGCYSPLTGYYSRDVGTSGKRGITFQRGLSFSGVPIRLPCGVCIGCRLEHSRQWAVRCLHEKRLHDVSLFLTLTYRNECLPPGGTLVLRDLQLFFKRLRKLRGPFRYYACGEYGELNRRPHYHVILFGLDFPDKLRVASNARGDSYYESSQLSEVWKLGNTMIGDVTFDSAAYVARYCVSKILGTSEEAQVLAKAKYEVMDSDGVIYERKREFTVMSRNPGIAAGYYDKFGQEVRDHDSVIVNGREVRPPRFYDARTEALDPELMERVKARRRAIARQFKADQTPDRRRVREALAIKLLKAKERRL